MKNRHKKNYILFILISAFIISGCKSKKLPKFNEPEKKEINKK